MKATKHHVVHAYQPDNHSCGQTALSILLSHYGRTMLPGDIMKQIPHIKNDAGETCGTTGQGLATWCIAQDFDATIFAFDNQILDLTWAGMDATALLERLEQVKTARNIAALGKRLSEFYVQGYIDFLRAGGELHIGPYPKSALLYQLLEKGPILACVGFNTLYGYGRMSAKSLRVSEPDDVAGILTNHFIVIYGNTDSGDFLVADPWEKPGHLVVEPEQMLAGIMAAEKECDNLVFYLTSRQIAQT